MPNQEKHLSIAKNNENFSEELVSAGRHLDWAVTSLFYASIHYLEAYLAARGRHSASHRMRDSAIVKDPSLEPIYDEYNELKNDSIQARYFGYGFSPTEIETRVRPSINKIRTHISEVIR